MIRTMTIWLFAAALSLTSFSVQGDVNQWELSHPSGPDSALGGTAFDLSVAIDGQEFIKSGFNNFYTRTDSSEAWQKYVPMLKNGTLLEPRNFIHSATTPGKITANDFSNGGNRIVRSNDYGQTWSLLSINPNQNLLGVSPLDATHFFAWDFANDGFVESVDDGATWSSPQPTIGLTSPRALNIDSTNPAIRYVLDSFIVKKSVDGGLTWAESAVDPGAFDFFEDLKMAPSNSSMLYAASSGSHIMSVSSDGGESWNTQNLFDGLRAGPMSKVDVDPLDANRAIGVGSFGGVFLTEDGGQIWDRLVEPPSWVDWFTVAFKPDSEAILTGVRGIGKLTPTNEVEMSNAGFSDFTMTSLVRAPSNSSIVYAGGRGGVAVFDPVIGNWEVRQGSFDTQIKHIAVDAQDAQHALVGTFFTGIQETFDAGITWNELLYPQIPPPNSVRFVSYIEIAPSDAQVIYLRTGAGLYRSPDAGQNWNLIRDTALLPSIQKRNALTIAPNDSDRLYLVSNSRGIIMSADGGSTWSDTTGLFQTDETTDVEVSPHDPAVVYAATDSSSYWRSNDSGQTWEDLSDGTFLGSFRDIEIDPFVPGRIFALFNDAEFQVFQPHLNQWVNLGDPTPTFLCSDLDEQSDCQIMLDPERQGHVTVHVHGELYSILLDSDADGVGDDTDNCTFVSNTNQLDTDADELGNACDGDFNNDMIVNFLDIALFSGAFLSSEALFDLNGDGNVNFLDFSILTEQFLLAPGPGANGVMP